MLMKIRLFQQYITSYGYTEILEGSQTQFKSGYHQSYIF